MNLHLFQIQQTIHIQYINRQIHKPISYINRSIHKQYIRQKFQQKRMLIDSTPQRPNSQSTINKLLEKDLKQLVFGLDSTQLITFFRNLQTQTQTNSSKQFTKIGMKCVQCHTLFDTFQSKGYGRDQQDALINSIKIILQNMISSSYRLQSIRKALRYCPKYKQPLINSSYSSSLLSSTKKSMRKVQGLQTAKMTKKHLDYTNLQESTNKENMSKRINQTLHLNAQSIQDKLSVDSRQIRLGSHFSKAIEARPSSPIEHTSTEQQGQNRDKKCSQMEKGKDCIYFEIQKHSQKQIKSLNARIRLLEEQNSILKELLLKDFNKEYFNKNKPQEALRN